MTPLMKQYWEIKNNHLDKVLLFRMGDFYEIFHDDAVLAAPILNIALTSRNKKSADDTPMCGVPHHSIAGPIAKLLQAGHKVAMCDQLEDPETAKGIVKRGVTRILSPGMVYDPETLNELQANYLCSYDDTTISFLESSTGEAFYYNTSSGEDGLRVREQLLALLRPVELVLTSKQKSEIFKAKQFDAKNSVDKIATSPLLIAGEAVHLTVFDSAEPAPKRLLAYAKTMQGEQVLSTIKPFEERKLSVLMPLSETVLRHLEIFKTTKGEDKGSLFHAICRTKTSAGARLLKSWLQFPLIDKSLIEERQNKVEKWTQNLPVLKSLRQALQAMGDIERRLSKISYSNCNVHDLVALQQSLDTGLSMVQFCPELQADTIKAVQEIATQIRNTLIENPPLQTKMGGFIRKDYSPRLLELVTLAEESQRILLELETREREKTGISSLKIRYNNVFGYYIEVTNSHTQKVPDHYKRKQTLANAERYITQELHELESKILSSRSQRVELEESIFNELRKHILSSSPQIRVATQAWSELDVVSSLSWLAIENKYVRPQFNSGAGADANRLSLKSSRHAVIEQEVKAKFVPNDIELSAGHCLLLTGPNMAGKSTLMRQVAVIALMAQIGSFVPCNEANLPVFDKIFTRIGASDSLAEGLSTFMVEMKETAEMLLNANEKSLVILDEVGRGTSTYDGMSLAQSILEYLVTAKKPIVFFATHYHELTQLEEQFKTIKNGHMQIEEKASKDQSADFASEIRFLYALRPGPANKSYGLHVARLAGLPSSILKRAESLLSGFEEAKGHDITATGFNVAATLAQPAQLPLLFQLNESDERLKAIADDIQDLKVSSMTPLAALNKISEWQQKLS
jgi:DNA mismatch repair protein MutS